MKKNKVRIDFFGDDLIVPVPKGTCGDCKYTSIQLYNGHHYIHQPRRKKCGKCNIANGMKHYEQGDIEWAKITTLSEKNPIVRDGLLKEWTDRSVIGW